MVRLKIACNITQHLLNECLCSRLGQSLRSVHSDCRQNCVFDGASFPPIPIAEIDGEKELVLD